MGFEDIRQPEKSQERVRLQRDVRALLLRSASLEDVVELLGAEKFLTKERGRGKSGAVLDFRVEDFVQWVVDSTENQNYQIQLPDHMISLAETILPPDSGEVRTGSGTGFERTECIPRTRYLVDLLTKMKLQYAVVSGTNSPEMMRKMSYKAFLLPQIGKMVLVCDEEGNATYLVNDVLGEGNWKSFIGLRKSELRDLADNGKVAVVSYQGESEAWKERIFELLSAKEFGASKKKESDGVEGGPPEGWFTVSGLVKKLGRDRRWVEKRVDEYRGVHPEWFGSYRNPVSRQIREYLAPQIVSVLEKAATEKYETAPVDWRNVHTMADELGTDSKTIERVLSLLPAIGEEQRGMYLSRAGRPTTFYHPGIFSVVREKLEKRVLPDEFVLLRDLIREAGIDYKTACSLAGELSTPGSEEFQVVEVSPGNKQYRLHKNLADRIRKDLAKRIHAPAGWVRRGVLAKMIGRDPEWIDARAGRYFQRHPEWKGMYLIQGAKNNNVKLVLHFSPELVSMLIRENEESELDRAKAQKEARLFEERKDRQKRLKSDDWKSIAVLAKESEGGHSHAFVRGLVEEYFGFHPDLRKGQESVFESQTLYSPEVSKYVFSKLSEIKSAPDGWESLDSLREILGRDQATIRKMAKPFLVTYPDEQRDFFGKQKMSLHYGPNVVAALKERLSLLKNPPEGWMDREMLARAVGRSTGWVENRQKRTRLTHPEWFGDFLNRSNNVIEYSSPDFFSELKRESREEK